MIQTIKINPLYLLILAVAVAAISCKSKQKVSDISDTQEVKEQMEQEEMEEETPAPEPPRNVERVPSEEERLTDYFEAISSSAGISSANSSINEALTMFSNQNAPVLIVFYEANGQPSYDEPTTIGKYLNYLKDTKNFNTRIEEVVRDSNGKIKELVLKKSKLK